MSAERRARKQQRSFTGRAIALLTAAAAAGSLAMGDRTALGAGIESATPSGTAASGQASPTPDAPKTSTTTATRTSTPTVTATNTASATRTEVRTTPTPIASETPDTQPNCLFGICDDSIGALLSANGPIPQESNWQQVTNEGLQLNIGSNQLLIWEQEFFSSQEGPVNKLIVLMTNVNGVNIPKDSLILMVDSSRINKDWFKKRIQDSPSPVQFQLYSPPVKTFESSLLLNGESFIPTATPTSTATITATSTAILRQTPPSFSPFFPSATASVDSRATATATIRVRTPAATIIPAETSTATPTPPATAIEIVTFTPTVAPTNTATATEIPATPTPIPPFIVEVPAQKQEPLEPQEEMRIRVALDQRAGTIQTLGLKRLLEEGIEIPKELQEKARQRVRILAERLMGHYDSAAEFLRDENNRFALEEEGAKALKTSS